MNYAPTLAMIRDLALIMLAVTFVLWAAGAIG